MKTPLRVVTLLSAGVLVAAPVARADGDPASDYLLARATFVPPDDGIPTAYANQLTAAVRDARARGYTIRVALIGSPYDMGSVTALYRRPKQYARFLGTELALIYKRPLLIVMPNGLAVSRAGTAAHREQAVVDRIPPPGSSGKALASAGTTAVIRLAANAGVVVREPVLAATGRATSGSHATRERIMIAVIALGAVLTWRLYARYRRRVRARLS